MKYILIALTLIFARCSFDEQEPRYELSAGGLLINRLPSDGCDWHFELNFGSDLKYYAADDESYTAVVAPVIQMMQAPTWDKGNRVEVNYELNYTLKDVRCGFGVLTSMEEIKVKSIRVL